MCGKIKLELLLKKKYGKLRKGLVTEVSVYSNKSNKLRVSTGCLALNAHLQPERVLS